MYLILLAAGVLAVLTGVVMFGSALPVENVRTSALLISGVVGLVGGMILCGLGLAVRLLGRIAERLETQPLPMPIAPVSREKPAPGPIRTPVAEETPPPAVTPTEPRPSLLSWFGSKKGAKPDKPVDAAVPDKPEKPAEPVEPKVDLGPPVQVPEPPREPPAPVVPPVLPPPTPPPVAPSLRAPPRPVAPPAAPPAPMAPKVTPPVASAPAPAAASAAGSTVYRSGVIDGMAYTLFMDGSIQAELPQGLVKFNTIDELQKYLLAPRN